MERKFKYDAFISYRHAELDKFVAENLHKELEKFRLPKTLAKKRPGQKNRIERVFRDKEELPLTSNLSDPIMAALNDSEYLIVICSPRLKESMWCKKEVETFVGLRGREHIMAVLVEGEPMESFPEELLFRVERMENPDGTVEKIKIPVEHFAADVRGKSKREVKKLLPREVQRLCAGMFHIDFDDIRQRHREQKMRRIMRISCLAGIAFMILGIGSTITAMHIHNQNKELEAQSAEIQMQAEQIMDQNRELAYKQAVSLAELAQQYLDSGNRQLAMATAVESMTESDGIGLPHTPEGQYVLAESVRAYDIGVTAKAEYQVEVRGRIEKVMKSPNGEMLAIFDDTGAITVFDLKERKAEIVITTALYNTMSRNALMFWGNNKLVYINKNDKVCILDLETKCLIKELESPKASGLITDQEGQYLAIKQTNDTYVIVDGSTYEEIGVTAVYDDELKLRTSFLSEDGVMALVYSQPSDVPGSTDRYQLQFINLDTMEVLSTVELENKMVVDLEWKDGIAYVALSEYSEKYVQTGAIAMAIDVPNGNVLWETVVIGGGVEGIAVPQNEDATDLLFITSQNIAMIQLENGHISFSEIISHRMIELYVYPDQNSYLMFLENGEMAFVDRDMGMVMDVSYRFACKTTSNAFICNGISDIAVAERNDNKITVYTFRKGPEVEEFTGEISLPDNGEFYEDDEAQEIARSYGLDDADYVQHIYYSDDRKYCFVTYGDDCLVIYDTETQTIVNSIDLAYETERYFGMDETGNAYLGGVYGIYVMNGEMKPLMWIEHGEYVDLEEKKVYLNWLDDYYVAPLYGAEDLIEIAEHYGN